MSPPAADGLVSSELECRCLDELRAATGETDGVMELHCVRCFLFMEMVAAKRGLEIDREIALCASILHDVGLYPSVTHGGVYTDEGGELARKLFADAGATPERAQLGADVCAYHHALRDQSPRGPEVELLRVADRLELSGGLLRGGLSRAQVHDVFAAHSRKGLYPAIARLVARALRERPTTVPKIFRLSRG